MHPLINNEEDETHRKHSKLTRWSHKYSKSIWSKKRTKNINYGIRQNRYLCYHVLCLCKNISRMNEKRGRKAFFVSENKTNGYKQQKLFLKITNTIQELSHKLWMEIIVGILALKLSVFFAGKLCTLNEIDFFQFIDIMAN